MDVRGGLVDPVAVQVIGESLTEQFIVIRTRCHAKDSVAAVFEEQIRLDNYWRV